LLKSVCFQAPYGHSRYTKHSFDMPFALKAVIMK
jgi:hypothetical protein